MVGLVKIFKVEKHKEGSRVSFLCGREALERVEQYMLAALDASNLLSIKETELPDGVERLQQEKKELSERLTECTGKLLEYRIAEMQAHPTATKAGHKKFVFLEPDMMPKEAKALAKRLGEICQLLRQLLHLLRLQFPQCHQAGPPERRRAASGMPEHCQYGH